MGEGLSYLQNLDKYKYGEPRLSRSWFALCDQRTYRGLRTISFDSHVESIQLRNPYEFFG